MLGNMTTLARTASRRTLQRHVLPHCRGAHLASLSLPMATLHQPQRPAQSVWLGGLTALAITSSLACLVSCTANSTLCEETQTAEHNQENADEEEDPYENLPDEDEPTACFLCLTYRKGPCRPYWRKFERCVKDNSPSDADEGQEQSKPDNDTPNPCGKYAMPFAQCSVEYFELYELIRNHTFQEDYFDQPESLQDEHNAIPSNTHIVDMDWTAWSQYSTVEQPPISESKSLKDNNNNDNTVQRLPLWQQLGTLHPELTHVQVTVHRNDPDTGYPLSVVYARDQDANFMGLAHPKTETNKEDSKTAATSNDNGDQVTARTNDDEESPSDPTINNPDSDTTAVVELKVTIVPSHTQSFVVYAVYKDEAPPPPKDDDTTKNLEQEPLAAVVPMRIYKSSPQFLADHRHPKDESSSAQ